MSSMKIKIIALFGVLLVAACKPQSKFPTPDAESTHEGHEHGMGSGEKKILHYTCSMHPFIKQDKPGRCPICGMELVPVFAESGAESQAQTGSDPGAIQVGASRRQLIGVQSEPVIRGELVREIEAMGRVAYDPDLYVAQNDYLLARRTGGGDLGGLQGGLVRASRSRLQLMGMSDPQIRELERGGKAQPALVLPQAGSGVWIYASVFESDLPWVKPGDAVTVEVPGAANSYSSQISSIDPRIDPGTRTATLRIRLSDVVQELRPDMFVKVRVKGEGGAALLVPATAVLATGKRHLVYLDRGEGKYEALAIKLGRRGSDQVEVIEGLKEGDLVVTQGNFLLDSESSLQGVGGSGEHRHYD